MLVSCAAAGKAHSQDLLAGGEGVGAIKRAGEAGLRRTGLGYTIVRPAELIEEPGGYKALLFDQVPACKRPLIHRVSSAWMTCL